MKKTIIISTTALSLLSIITYTIPFKEKLEGTITGIHTKTFAIDNLYKTQLNAKEWNDVIEITYDFIKERYDTVEKQRNKNILSNLRSTTAKRNQLLLKNYERIKAANNELINTIKIAYASLFKSNTPKDATILESLSTKFTSIQNDMGELEKYLAKELTTLKNNIKSEPSNTKKLLLKEQEDAISVLHRLALTLELTAQKANNDLKK